MRDQTSIVALIGLRCSGKTSVGRELSKLLDRPLVDLDVELARRFARERKLDEVPPAGEILARHGESVFRDAEQSALEDALSREDPCVLATGGGVVERSVNRERLHRSAVCVWLSVSIAELERRMRLDRGTRPALLGGDPVGEIAELAARRDPLYALIADYTIECGTRGAAELAREIAGLLRIRT